MKALDVPVTIDATHAVQLPGADPRTSGGSTGGRREGVSIIAQSAIAAGADGVFLEFHEEPDKALCDGPSCLDLQTAEPLLARLGGLVELRRQLLRLGLEERGLEELTEQLDQCVATVGRRIRDALLALAEERAA